MEKPIFSLKKIVMLSGILLCFVFSSFRVYAACDDPAGPGVDWSGCEFVDKDFSGLELRGANFSSAVFKGNTNFSGVVNIGGANFLSATFYGNTNFSGLVLYDSESLTYSSFAHAFFQGPVDFSNAKFMSDDTNKRTEYTGKVNFSGATFNAGANFSDTYLFDASFYNVSFTNTSSAEYATVNFTNAGLNRASFEYASLSKVKMDLSGAWIKPINFASAQIENSKIFLCKEGLKCSGSDLGRFDAKLKQIHFRQANFINSLLYARGAYIGPISYNNGKAFFNLTLNNSTLDFREIKNDSEIREWFFGSSTITNSTIDFSDAVLPADGGKSLRFNFGANLDNNMTIEDSHILLKNNVIKKLDFWKLNYSDNTSDRRSNSLLDLSGTRIAEIAFQDAQFDGAFSKVDMRNIKISGEGWCDYIGDSCPEFPLTDLRGTPLSTFPLLPNGKRIFTDITLTPDQVLYNPKSDNVNYVLLDGSYPYNHAYSRSYSSVDSKILIPKNIKILSESGIGFNGALEDIEQNIVVNLAPMVTAAESFYRCDSSGCAEQYRLFQLYESPVSGTPALTGKLTNAVDFITDKTANAYISTTTGEQSSPYWQLDLGQFHHIEKIRIHPHPDAEHSGKILAAELLLSDSPFQGEDFFIEQNYDYISRYRGMKQGEVVEFKIGHSARYIRLARAKGESQLAFGEIEVFGLLRQTTNDTPVTEISQCGGFDEIKIKTEECNNYSLDDLSYCNLKSKSLIGVDFSGKNLTNADFSGANLKNANFKNTDLTNANFKGAILTGANLYNAYVPWADFRGADFGKNYNNEDYGPTNFDRIRVQGACFSRDNWVNGTGPVGTNGYSVGEAVIHGSPAIVMGLTNNLFGYVRQSSTDLSRPANYANQLNNSSATIEETSPWWILDIGATYNIDSIDLSFADDCSACDGNIRMFISDWTMPSDPLNNREVGWSEIAVVIGAGETASYSVGRSGRFIAIQAGAATFGRLAIKHIKAHTSAEPVIPGTIRPSPSGSSVLAFSSNVIGKKRQVTR